MIKQATIAMNTEDRTTWRRTAKYLRHLLLGGEILHLCQLQLGGGTCRLVQVLLQVDAV